MMNRDRVSIIIPCHNAEAYVGDAIRSALSQVYDPCEVVVIDDGSTDGTLDVVRSFGEAIRWHSGPNRGGGAARNLGVRMAEGNWIQFLDADDVLYPGKVRQQVAAARSSRADMVFCDYRVVNEPGGPNVGPRLESFDGGDPVPFVLHRQIQTSAPLHPRAAFLEVGGFDESLPCAQEFDLHLRLACEGITFEHLPEELHEVRLRDRSVSSDYARVLDQFERILWNAYRVLERRNGLTQDRRRAFAQAMARAARHYLQRGFRNQGRRYFEQAKQMHARGALDVYDRPARWICRLLGPGATESLSALKRRRARRASSIPVS